MNYFQSRILNQIKALAALFALLYFVKCIVSPLDFHYIAGVNLVIHEAGHVIFTFFGDFMRILGGSLTQVLLPLIFVIYFYVQKDYFSGSILLFWVGENLVEVSIYAGDAIARQLPLLGGDTSGHDWHNLLTRLNVLKYTPQIAGTIYILGLLTITAAAVLSFTFSFEKKVIASDNVA
jgi:hypothetical protein